MSRWLIASCGLTLLAFGAWTWLLIDPSIFPDTVPIHWDIHDQPNSWADARTAVGYLVFAPAIMLFCIGLSFAIPWMSPEPFSQPADRSRLDFVLLLVVGLFAWMFCVIVNGMRTSHIEGLWLLAPIFVLFGLLGPGMRGVRRNGLFGVRTPWTLASDDVWHRTHEMTAKVWMAIGVLGVILCAIGVPFWVPLLLLLPAVIWPIVYSYRISRVKPDQPV